LNQDANSTAVFITLCLASYRCQKRQKSIIMLLCLSKPCTNIIMLDYFCFLYLINDKQNNITDETFNYNITDQKRNMLSKTKQKTQLNY